MIRTLTFRAVISLPLYFFPERAFLKSFVLERRKTGKVHLGFERNKYNQVGQREDYLYVVLATNLLMLQYYRSKVPEYYSIQQSQMSSKHQYHTRQETRSLSSTGTTTTKATTTTR